MYKFLTVIIRIFIAIPVLVITWLVSFFALDLSYWYASLLSITGAAFTYGILSIASHIRFLKKHQLKLREYRYIRRNLHEAHHKIRRIQKSVLSIRHLTVLKEIMEIVRLMKKIYRVTKKEPHRFYQGEQFYFTHLDSAVELTEKYALLSSQPKKNEEMERVLTETRHTIKEMKTRIEKDLYHILSDDIENLQFELHYVNKSAKNKHVNS